MKAEYSRYLLDFNFLARTSRGEMRAKETFFIRLTDLENGRSGVGECGVFRGLSADDLPDYEEKLADVCRTISSGSAFAVTSYSSIKFGLETAAMALNNGGNEILFPSAFTEGKNGVPINGLVWMDSIEKMSAQIEQKLKAGFKCIKIKIGQYDFNSELKMIERLRLQYGPDEIEIRLDANGAYTLDEALANLNRLAPLDIHSVEQPIKAGQWDKMAYLCGNSPQPIALDEELIGVDSEGGEERMIGMLREISPAYIVLKPSLCGGLSGAEHWIELAGRFNIGWWITSALESNIGLNALAQWTAALNPDMCQGLGTGMLYTNNFPSPLYISDASLRYMPGVPVDYSRLQWIEPK